ncbi:MAG TPA: MerR family transcriptional regulator [Alphaproteobacteria bacterium]|nr:MerR family transcriptional regulator [Alphaproteobacteria bacterium]
MRKDERYLSAAEAAKALGVSTRALRLYEQKGLVKPLRTESGWRAYGADALTRLHQIIALKHMGLELSTIARLLRGALSSLDSVLALQEQNLTARQAETHRALDLVRRARSRLSSGEALSVDDLTTLTRETTMNVQTINETHRMMDPLWRKYLTPNQYKRAMAVIGRQDWIESLIEAISALQDALKKGDANRPEALEAARKYIAVTERLTNGEADFQDRLRKMWADALSDPAIAPNLPFDSGVYFFFGQALRTLQARDSAQKSS